MEEMCAAFGAAGAPLLQSDTRTPDIPRTESVDERFIASRGGRKKPVIGASAPRYCDLHGSRTG
jgi:hypothetical protein